MIQNWQHFVTDYGYFAIFVGCILEGEIAMLAAAVAVQQGLLGLPQVVVAALLGAIVGDNFWFHVGRHLGERFVDRRARWRVQTRYVKRHLERSGRGFIIGTRFFYGLRTVTPILIGAARYPSVKFFVYDLIGTVLWLVLVVGIIYLLGSAISNLLEMLDTSRGALAMGLIGLIVLGVVAALFIWRLRVGRSVSHEDAD